VNLRESKIFAVFLGGFLFLAASGALRLARAWTGSASDAFLDAHRITGGLLYLLFLRISYRHVSKMGGRVIGWLAMAVQWTPLFVLPLQSPPSFALALGVALCVPLALVFARLAPSEYRRHLVAGFVSFALAYVVFFSGFLMGIFDPAALTGDALGWSALARIHRYAAVAIVPLLLLHVLRRYQGEGFWSVLRRPWTSGLVAAALLVPTIHGLRAWRANDARSTAAGYASTETRVVELAAMGHSSGERPVPTDRLIPPETCGNPACHDEMMSQWGTSAHRLAASDLAYTRVVTELAAEEGPDAPTFCARCHNPVAVLAGIDELAGDETSARIRRDGITCLVCHATTGADPESGNGHLTLTLEAPPPPIAGAPTGDDPSRFLARGIVAHSRSYRHPLQFDARFCATCHRIVTPREWNGGAAYVQEDLWTPWQESSAARAGVGCGDCHMPLHTYRHPVHARPDHRMFGTLTMLSVLAPPGLLDAGATADFDAKAVTWRRVGLPVPDYERWYLSSIRSGKSRGEREFLRRPRPIEMTVEAQAATPSGTALLVRSRNTTGAHPLPSGPLGLNELWLELTVTDAHGATVFESGTVAADGRVEAGAHRLGGTPVDRDGHPVQHDRLWRSVGVRDQRLLPPDGTVEDRFDVTGVDDPSYPLAVAARWRSRRLAPDASEWILNDAAATPIVDLAEARLRIDHP